MARDIEVVKMPNGKLRGYGRDNDNAYKRFKGWLDRLEPGEMFFLSWKLPRNPQHHRKFMALVTYIAENSDVYDSKEKALTAVKYAAGHCDFIPDPKTGGLVPIPRSISFDEMDQEAFDEFYRAALDGVVKHILPHLNVSDLQVALTHIAQFG